MAEHDDHVELNGVIFNKPFVEKPVSAEDHNIFMYYPTSAGRNIWKSRGGSFGGSLCKWSNEGASEVGDNLSDVLRRS